MPFFHVSFLLFNRDFAPQPEAAAAFLRVRCKHDTDQLGNPDDKRGGSYHASSVRIGLGYSAFFHSQTGAAFQD
jgi:hypothetical protein